MIGYPAACLIQMMSSTSSFLTLLKPAFFSKPLVLILGVTLANNGIAIDEIYVKGQFIRFRVHILNQRLFCRQSFYNYLENFL